MVQPSLDITLVNFSDPYDINAFVSCLCQVSSNLGMSMPGFKPTRETNEIRQIANKVVRRLDEQLPKMTAADAFAVISAYDLAYRFAYLTSPDSETINRYVLTAFDAMIHGDRSVDQYKMYQTIAQAVRRRDKAYFDRPLLWLTLTEEQWYNEAKRGFDATTLTDHDIASRLTILLRADLSAYEGHNQPTFKSHLLTHYHRYLDKTANPGYADAMPLSPTA